MKIEGTPFIISLLKKQNDIFSDHSTVIYKLKQQTKEINDILFVHSARIAELEEKLKQIEAATQGVK